MYVIASFLFYISHKIEAKHVDGTFDSIAAGDTVSLKAAYLVGTPAVAFKAVEKTVLGEKAVIVRIEAAE